MATDRSKFTIHNAPRTINDWRFNYETYQRHVVRPATYSLYHRSLEVFFGRFPDKKFIEEFTAGDVEDFKIALLREGKKARYVNLLLSIAASFWTFVQNVHDHKCVSPFVRVRRLKTAEVVHIQCGTTELEKLFAVAEEPLDKLLVLLGSMTGLRGEEMALLDWNDIDFETRTLSLPAHKAKGRVKGRCIPLHDDLVALLQEVKAFGTPTVFGDYGKSRMGLYYRLAKLSKTAGVDVTPHALRRSFATSLMRAGVDLKSIQMCLGHSNIAITSAYLQGSETEEIRNKLSLIHPGQKEKEHCS